MQLAAKVTGEPKPTYAESFTNDRYLETSLLSPLIF